MATDLNLQEVDFIAPPVAARLADLEIRTLRQLAARLTSDRETLREYLDLDPPHFHRLCSDTEALVERRFPDAALPAIFPKVHRQGVAVHRLDDPARPRFRADND